MSNKIAQLAAQRAALVNQVALQRIELGETFETISRPVNYIEQGLFVARYFAKHPLILAGSLAIAVAVGRNRWVKFLKSGLLAWQILAAAKHKLEDKSP